MEMPDFNNSFEPLDQCLIRRMQLSGTPALVAALTDRFDTVRLSAYGYADLDSKIPVQVDALFGIGSIGKSLTSLAVLQAYEAGLLDLHTPISHYLPWFQVQSSYRPITLHHLLTHTSGLLSGSEFSPDPRAAVYVLRDYELGFEPGTHFYYSDEGYKLAGLVLEAVTHKTYAELIWLGILEPLGMHNTYAYTTNDLRFRAARGYRYAFDDRPGHPGQSLVPAEWVETNSGDGCILSTAEDMVRYARFFLNDGFTRGGVRLLSEENFKKMITPMIEENGEQYSYGLNLFVDDGIHHAGHGGDVPGYECYLWLDLDNRLAAATMMTTPYTPRASFIALEYLRNVYLTNQPLELPPMPDHLHVRTPSEYTGTYVSNNAVVHVFSKEHHLFLSWGENNDQVVLEERENDVFYANHPQFNLFLLQFGRNSEGKVVELFNGPTWYRKDSYDGPLTFETPPQWEAYCGHYRAHNPWQSNFRVFIRKGKMILAWPHGEEEDLVQLRDDCFRIGQINYIPERLIFDQIVDGQALRATRSGCPYYRFFTP